MNHLKHFGRPPIFESEQELEEYMAEYFDECEESGKNPTFAGLARRIGVDRSTLYSYRKEHHPYSTAMKKAIRKIEECLENKLMTEGKAGQIFLAKNYGYVDRQELLTENVNHNIELDLSDDDIIGKLDALRKRIDKAKE